MSAAKTPCPLGGGCSIQLSYRDNVVSVTSIAKMASGVPIGYALIAFSGVFREDNKQWLNQIRTN